MHNDAASLQQHPKVYAVRRVEGETENKTKREGERLTWPDEMMLATLREKNDIRELKGRMRRRLETRREGEKKRGEKRRD